MDKQGSLRPNPPSPSHTATTLQAGVAQGVRVTSAGGEVVAGLRALDAFPRFTWDSQLVICFGLCSAAWAAAAFLITLNMHMGVWNHTGNKLVTSSAPNQRARQHPTFSPPSSPPSSPDSLDQPQEGNYISLGWPSAGKQAPTGLVLGEDEDILWGRLKKCKSLPQIREVTYPRLFGRLKV